MGLFRTHSYTKKPLHASLGPILPFFFLASRLLRISTKWKIELFFFFQSLLTKGALVLFYHLVGCHSNWMEMRSWYFPDKSSVTGLRVYGLREPGASRRYIQGPLRGSVACGAGCQGWRVLRRLHPHVTEHVLCWISFHANSGYIKSFIRGLPGGSLVLFRPQNLSFPLNTNWTRFSESRDHGYFIKLLWARRQFSKRAKWTCDGNIQVWRKEWDGGCLVSGDFCLVVNSFLQQIFTGYLRCVRQCARIWRYSSKSGDEVKALGELSLILLIFVVSLPNTVSDITNSPSINDC